MEYEIHICLIWIDIKYILNTLDIEILICKDIWIL